MGVVGAGLEQCRRGRSVKDWGGWERRVGKMMERGKPNKEEAEKVGR